MDASGQIIFVTKCMTTLQSLFQQRKLGSWQRLFEELLEMQQDQHSMIHRHAPSMDSEYPFNLKLAVS